MLARGRPVTLTAKVKPRTPVVIHRWRNPLDARGGQGQFGAETVSLHSTPESSRNAAHRQVLRLRDRFNQAAGDL